MSFAIQQVVFWPAPVKFAVVDADTGATVRTFSGIHAKDQAEQWALEAAGGADRIRNSTDIYTPGGPGSPQP